MSLQSRPTVYRKEKPRGIFVNEDLSHRVMERIKQLMPMLREARSNGEIAYLKR